MNRIIDVDRPIHASMSRAPYIISRIGPWISMQRLEDILSDLDQLGRQFRDASDKLTQSRLQIKQLDLIQQAAQMMSSDAASCYSEDAVSTMNGFTDSRPDLGLAHLELSILSSFALDKEFRHLDPYSTPNTRPSSASLYPGFELVSRKRHYPQESYTSEDLDNAIRLQVSKAKLVYVKPPSTTKARTPPRKSRLCVSPMEIPIFELPNETSPEAPLDSSLLKLPMLPVRRHSAPETGYSNGWIHSASTESEFNGSFDNQSKLDEDIDDFDFEGSDKDSDFLNDILDTYQIETATKVTSMKVQPVVVHPETPRSPVSGLQEALDGLLDEFPRKLDFSVVPEAETPRPRENRVSQLVTATLKSGSSLKRASSSQLKKAKLCSLLRIRKIGSKPTFKEANEDEQLEKIKSPRLLQILKLKRRSG